jgi:hypothetical protein
MAVMLSTKQRQKIRNAASAMQQEARRQRSSADSNAVAARRRRRWWQRGSSKAALGSVAATHWRQLGSGSGGRSGGR